MSDSRELQRQLAQITETIAKLTGEAKSQTFAEFATEYFLVKSARPSIRASTKAGFEHQLRRNLIPHFGQVAIDKIGNAEWLGYVAATRADVRGIRRFFNAHKVLNEILRAALDCGLISRKPRLDNVDERRDVGRALTEREILKILKGTHYDFYRLYFYTLWKTACRPREILKWEWSMINWGEPGHTWIKVPGRITKCDTDREIPLNPGVSRRLYKIFKQGNGSKYVWPDWNHPDRPQLQYHHQFRMSCTRAGVKCMPYDFRRTFLTKAAAEGKALVYVAKLLQTSVKMIEMTYAKKHVGVMEELVK